MLVEFLVLTILSAFFAILKVTFFLHPLFTGTSFLIIFGITIVLSVVEMLLRIPANRMGNGDLGISSVNIQLLWILATFIIACILGSYMLKEQMHTGTYIGFAVMFLGLGIALRNNS